MDDLDSLSFSRCLKDHATQPRRVYDLLHWQDHSYGSSIRVLGKNDV